MQHSVKTIEDLSLNAWPSWQMQVYDGWILRFSHFYTHRTNSVEQIGLSILPLPEKIAYCEEIYREWGTPCIFKIQPIGDPGLDPLLIGRGYHIEHATTVMVRELAAEDTPHGDPLLYGTGHNASSLYDTYHNTPPSNGTNHNDHLFRDTDHEGASLRSTDHEGASLRITDHEGASLRSTDHEGASLRITDHVDPLWLNGLFDLKGDTAAIHRRIVPNMYAAIPKKQIAVLLLDENRVIATGLGILDREYVGVYAIHVDPAHRRKGYASRIVNTILREGRNRGAKYAYLQVVSDNGPAKTLYRGLGFREFYRYYFRVK